MCNLYAQLALEVVGVRWKVENMSSVIGKLTFGRRVASRSSRHVILQIGLSNSSFSVDVFADDENSGPLKITVSLGAKMKCEVVF